jgi:hypothetical protein
MTDYMFEVSDKLKLKAYSVQIAMVYLDNLIHKFDMIRIKKQMHLWVVTLLLLACKFSDLDADVPYIDDFKKASIHYKYSFNSIVKCEKEICKKLEWNFMQICPLTFTHAHQNFGMVFADDKMEVSMPHLQTLEMSKMLGMDKEVKGQLKSKLKSIYKYSEFFSNVTLQMSEAQKYPYSIQSL